MNINVSVPMKVSVDELQFRKKALTLHHEKRLYGIVFSVEDCSELVYLLSTYPRLLQEHIDLKQSIGYIGYRFKDANIKRNSKLT